MPPSGSVATLAAARNAAKRFGGYAISGVRRHAFSAQLIPAGGPQSDMPANF
jgi:hypothetical protein